MNIEYFGKISPELLYEITLKDVYKFTSTGLLASPLTRKSAMAAKKFAGHHIYLKSFAFILHNFDVFII